MKHKEIFFNIGGKIKKLFLQFPVGKEKKKEIMEQIFTAREAVKQKMNMISSEIDEVLKQLEPFSCRADAKQAFGNLKNKTTKLLSDLVDASYGDLVDAVKGYDRKFEEENLSVAPRHWAADLIELYLKGYKELFLYHYGVVKKTANRLLTDFENMRITYSTAMATLSLKREGDVAERIAERLDFFHQGLPCLMEKYWGKK